MILTREAGQRSGGRSRRDGTDGEAEKNSVGATATVGQSTQARVTGSHQVHGAGDELFPGVRFRGLVTGVMPLLAEAEHVPGMVAASSAFLFRASSKVVTSCGVGNLILGDD